MQKLNRGTWGRDTNRILETVFHDSGRAPEVAEKLVTLANLIDEDRFEEARVILRELHEMIEEGDPELSYYEQMMPPEEAPVAAD